MSTQQLPSVSINEGKLSGSVAQDPFDMQDELIIFGMSDCNPILKCLYTKKVADPDTKGDGANVSELIYKI